MPSLVILGAGGFLGRAVLAAGNPTLPIKAVVHSAPTDSDSSRPGVSWFRADLLAPGALDEIVEAGDVVANLAFVSRDAGEANSRLIANVIDACLQRRAARLLHCSTAVVAGAVRQTHITESMACVPVTPYERIKWTLEQQVLGARSPSLDVGILRPTAIVGPGGQNLLTLARALRGGNTVVNYLRASLFGGRAMHLVPVRNVAAAVLHLATLEAQLCGAIYHVAADEDPDNNFATVERVMSAALGLRERRLPLLPLPGRLLELLLRLARRSDADTRRVYESRKLIGTGFKPVQSVVDAVRELGASLRES